MDTSTNRHWGRLQPADTPEWSTTEPGVGARAEAAFTHPPGLTVGVEEEVMLLDPRTFEIAPDVEDVLRAVGSDSRFKRELREGQLEIVTPVSGNAPAAGLHVAQARLDLHATTAGRHAVAAAGTHPFSAEWGDVVAGERYRQIADEHTWSALGNVPCGLHVHVGVDGAERALAVLNAARTHVPEIAALAANSPFAEGADSGLASSRKTLNDAFHRSGVPPRIASWASFDDLVAWGRRGGLYPDASHFWWDLRPNLRYGTLELRAPDAQTRVEDTVAVAAVFHSLVAWLVERHDAGEPLASHPSVRIRENMWRAVRYGVRGWLVDLDTGEPVPTRERISTLLDRIAPSAARLGNDTALLAARALVADNGAERQRYVAEELGLVELTQWLAHETVGSAADYLMRRA